MTLFSRLGAVFAAKAEPDLATLEALTADAAKAVEAAAAALDRARADLPSAILAGDEARRTARAAIVAAEADFADAEAALQAIRERLAAAKSEAAETERRRVYDAARASRDKAADRFRKEYPAAVGKLIELLKVCATADQLVEAANANRPADAPELLTAELHARMRVDLPREILSEEIVNLWVTAGTTNPAPESWQAEIKPVDPDYPDRGIRTRIREDGRTHVRDHFDVKRFVKRTVLPAVSHRAPPRLAASELFDLKGDLLWAPNPFAGPARTIDLIEQMAAEAGRPDPATTRKPVVELQLIVPEPESVADRPARIDYALPGDPNPGASPFAGTVADRAARRA
jgi:hypothetical protein